MRALFVLVALYTEGWQVVFGAAMAFVCALLCGFSGLVLVRTWGKTFELAVADTVEVPNLFTGCVRRLPLTAIRSGRIDTRRPGLGPTGTAGSGPAPNDRTESGIGWARLPVLGGWRSRRGGALLAPCP